MNIDDAREQVRLLESRGATEIDSAAVLVRLAARQVGYGGPLRAPLTKGGPAYPAGTAAQVEQLLPATKVRERPHRTLFRSWVAHATRGMPGMTRLSIEPLDGRPKLRVHLPQREDQIAEVIALAVDTALAVHARFGSASDHVREISFDHSMHEMTAGEVAGAAPQNLGMIHLNASYSFAQGLEDLGRSRGEPSSVTLSAPGSVPGPWTTIDGIVAHELWHKIEMAWEARRYAQTIEFRREIGRWFGQATLERVFNDGDACSELAAAVSPYAATNRMEATAEMFMLWWCGPPATGSIAERFGDLVETYFPRP